MRWRLLAIRFTSVGLIFSAVILALIFGDRGLLGFAGPLLLLGAGAGSASLYLAWNETFRFLYGLVTVMSAFWVQLVAGTPFYFGWTVLLLGLASILMGGASLNLRYLAKQTGELGEDRTGPSSIRKAVQRIGAFLFVVTVFSLLVLLVSFIFVLGTFPIWAAAACTAVLVLMFAYLISRSTEEMDQRG
jgi:hypothetical protein